nr:hypothetical protein PDK3.072 [Rhodococcus sp. DK17]
MSARLSATIHRQQRRVWWPASFSTVSPMTSARPDSRLPASCSPGSPRDTPGEWPCPSPMAALDTTCTSRPGCPSRWWSDEFGWIPRRDRRLRAAAALRDHGSARRPPIGTVRNTLGTAHCGNCASKFACEDTRKKARSG